MAFFQTVRASLTLALSRRERGLELFACPVSLFFVRGLKCALLPILQARSFPHVFLQLKPLAF